MMFELWQRNFLEQFKMNHAEEQPNCVAGQHLGVG
jgi:hypothetical protein